MRTMIVGLFCLALAGCTTTLNVQRSVLRAGGDLIATERIEDVDVDAVDAEKLAIKSAAQTIIDFLDTGDVSVLPLDGVRQALRDKLPEQYKYIADLLLAQAIDQTVSVDKIGPNNVKRLKAFAIGLKSGADEYAVEDRGE